MCNILWMLYGAIPPDAHTYTLQTRSVMVGQLVNEPGSVKRLSGVSNSVGAAPLGNDKKLEMDVSARGKM